MTPSREIVLVTGASGFIGSYVLERLRSAGHIVRTLTRDKQFTTLSSDELHQRSFGDLRNPESLIKACTDVDVIVHAAGIAHVGNSNKTELFSTNVIGTRDLLKAAEKQRVKRFVHISSSLAMFLDGHGTANTAYGQSKQEAENLVMDSHDAGRVESVVVRPVNVYGVGMKGSIPTLISMAHRWRLPALPQLDTCMSLISAQDLSRAIYLAIVSEKAAGKAYTVTDGLIYRINEIETEIYRILGRKVPFFRLPRLLLYASFFGIEGLNRASASVKLNLSSLKGISMRTYDNLITNKVFDNSGIVHDLKFKPEIDFYQELPSIIHSVIDNEAHRAD